MIWILLLLLQQVHSNEICSPGFYKSASEQCATCEPGKYQDLPEQTSCKDCIDGQYQNLYTATTCEACPSNIADGECIDRRLLCSAGKFNGRLSNICTKCSAGFFSNDIGTTSCESCPRGKSQNLEGKTSCDDCPEKTESNNTECQQCPSKWLRHSFLCSATCPDKTFQNTSDNNICESCERGKYLKDNTCTECPLGFVKEKDGPTDCNPCPQDYISNQQKCEKCGIHTVVDNNECKCKQGFKNESNVCVECSSTQFQDEIGQDSCKACPANEISGDNNVCGFCPSGTGYFYGSCKTCPNGWARDDSDDGTCKGCAKGKYSTDNRCVNCLIGFYQDQKAKTECKYCPNAEYQNEVGQTICKTCNESTPQTNLIGKGSTYCCDENQCDTDKCGPGRDRSSSNCTKCVAGRWSTQGSNCQDCPKGYIAHNEESHECLMCLDGQESNSDHTQCISCLAGKYEEGYECKSCARGKFNQHEGQTSCESCPLNGTKPQTTNKTGQTSDSNCEPCSNDWVIKSNGACGACGLGEFVESYECKTCPTGYFTDNNHQTSCKVCPPGETTIGPGASSCVFCTGDDCGCAPGQYGPPCETCPKGWWSTGGVKCNACTERTYQDEEGQNSCKNCVAGTYSDVIGLEQCKICPNGYFQNKDTQGSCFDCPIGRYSLSGYDKECDKCPAGSTTEYENSVSQGQCTECPAGKYESSGVCNDCLESFYQDEEGKTGCKSCPDTKWSEPGSASESEDCFETGTLTTYTFGNMEDQTTSSAFETTCEIRPNFVLLCPACTCNSDSRNGFWDGPLCNECQRGFATRYCTSICPGYNGQDDSTMCNGNGRCWFGRFGNGLCYCGGKHVIDQTAENSFVDVRTCPRGQICPGYGSSSVESASYIPQYYIIQYRQFTTFVLQMSKYTPERGHMWFKRYPPSKAYENSCSVCTSNYDSSLTTEIGYWAYDGEYKIFDSQAQTANGFHGENCQHECAVCLNNGYCVHSPHPFHYSYTIKDTFVEKGRVIIPTTACICRASVFDASHMCCPNGFQPYVYYGSKHTDPYSRFDTVPFITSIDNDQTLPYHRDRDLWLYSRNDEPQYPPVYSEPESGQFSVAVRSEIENKNYHEVGPYNKHVYHGTTREICRACPGLFGKGVRAQERLIQTEQEAEDYWWDFSASSGDKKCANQGVCDFYAKDREIDVDFMGNVATWSLLHRGVLCRSNPTFQFQDYETLEECVKYANERGALFVGFGPDFYKGGNDGQLISINGGQTEQNAKDSSRTAGKKGWARKDSFVNDAISSNYYFVSGKLPPPDSDSEYKIFPNFKGNKCIGYTKCDSYTENSYQYNIYDVTRGRGDDRFYRTSVNALTLALQIEESTYDRFDTCFTYTKDNNRAQFDLYLTIGYKQGLDPFIGGLCPRGYFCTQTDDAREPNNNGIPPVGYKEACPPGYFQPQYGITRTDNNVRCNKGIHNMRYEVSTDFCTDTTDTYVRNGNKQIKDAVECKAAAQYLGLPFTNVDFNVGNYDTNHNYPRGCFKSQFVTSGTTVTQIFYNNNEKGKEECTTTSGSIGCVCRKSNPCQMNTATFQDNDYVDSVCLRCPRHKWSGEGSYECNACPKGTVKKISGNFDPGKLDVFNMDTIQNDHWYYIQNEIGTEQDDCAKVPPAVVQIPQLNTVMKETAQNQQFLPLITCPYGFSNRPGTYVIQDTWALSNIATDIDFALPPYVKNNGIESAIVSDVPCDCIAEDKENGIKYLTPPTLEKCWQYAHVSSTLPICKSNSMGNYVLSEVECSGNRRYVMDKDECSTYANGLTGLDFQEQELQAGPPGCSKSGNLVFYTPSTLGACNSNTQCVCFEENIPSETQVWAGTRCTTAGEGVNAEYMDEKNIFWDGCSKFKDSNTVHYQYTANQPTTYVKNTPDSLQFICLKKVTNIELTKQIAAQYCFTCPGDSITGPDTGICSTCPGNMVKKNMKLAIQKLVERSYPRLYQCYSSIGNVIVNNIKQDARSYVGTTTTAPKDELIKCETPVKRREDTSIDVQYKEDNIQAWQFIIDEDTIWKVDSVFWPIIESPDMKVSKLTLSDCVLACSTTWGSKLNKDRKVRVGIALKESDRNFCLCNDGGSTEAYYRYVGALKTDVLRQAKYKKNYTVQTERCDDITSIEDCEYAAAQIGKSLSDYVFSAAQKIKIPHGCYQKNDGIVFYNDGEGLEACTSDSAAGCVCVDKEITTSDDDYNHLSTPSSENILWYQSQVEEPWNKIRPLCGSCTPGKILRGSKCENCAEGQFTSTPEEAMQLTCQNCPMGFYQSSRGKSYCSMCMVGLAINTVKAQNCKECQAGYYGNERGKGPATNYITVDDSYIKCKECPIGFFQAFSKKTSCDECVPGKYESEHAQTTCKQCEPGEYTDQNRQIDCKDCPKGYHNSLTSQPSCKECSPGKYEDTKKQIASYCKECAVGKYQNEAAQLICKDCQPSGTAEKPDGKIREGKYYGYQDSQGQTNCKACIGGHTCTGSARSKCPAGNVNAKQPSTIFTTTCTECTGRNAANSDATKCEPCGAPKKHPSSSGIGCNTCTHGSHSVTTSSEGRLRPICTPCSKSQKIISTGCADCDAGKVMDATNDQKCAKCTGNTIASDGVCIACPDLNKPNTDHTKCEYCGGYGWDTMFTGIASTSSDTGSKFNNAVWKVEDYDCKNDGPGPQIICYATWKIKFTESTDDLCFEATDYVDDQVAIYIRDTGTSVGFPKYFDQKGCACNGGCACMTDYPFLMDFDKDWGKKSSLQWWYRGGTGEKCMDIDVAKGDTKLLVMWFFNEDDGAGNQGLQLDTSTAFKAKNTC